MKNIEPIFIVSMPRAGSTLLQRLLMGHPSIDSCGEPWLALPLVYMLREEGTMAEYGHQSAVRSLQGFVSGLPQGEDDYFQMVAGFLGALYCARASDGAEYFIDKTPRYYKILTELQRMFPNSAKIIILRNPLGVYASMLNFINGNLRYLPMWQNDWIEGQAKISEAIVSGEEFYVTRFEDIVAQPHREVEAIMGTLGLDYDPSQVDNVAGQRLNRGDPTGVERYEQVDTSPLESWKASIDTPSKKRIALKWLRAMPDQQWVAMSYDKEATIESLLSHRPAKRWSPKESISLLVGRIYFYSGLHLLRKVYRKDDTGFRPFYN